MVLLHKQNYEIILSCSFLNETFQSGPLYNYLVISECGSLEPQTGFIEQDSEEEWVEMSEIW